MKNNITAIALYCTLNFSALMAQDASPGFILGYHLIRSAPSFQLNKVIPNG
ncbi:MAG: hypothetical protein U0T81_08600 [Saprospiraceae bacterium]